MNLETNAVEIHQTPSKEGYAKTRSEPRGKTLTVPGISGAKIKVDDILG